MTVSTTAQLFSMLWGLLSGAVCAAAAAVIGAVRQELKPGPVLTMAADLLFWIFSASAVICINLKFGDGSVRLYQLLAAACGFALYLLCLGGLTRRLARLAMKGLRLILRPAFFLLRGIRLYFNDIICKIKNVFNKIKRGFARFASAGKMRKKIQKNYKKML